MANTEIRSVEGLAGSGVPYAYAVKAGPWLFLTGHEAFDFGHVDLWTARDAPALAWAPLLAWVRHH